MGRERGRKDGQECKFCARKKAFLHAHFYYKCFMRTSQPPNVKKFAVWEKKFSLPGRSRAAKCSRVSRKICPARIFKGLDAFGGFGRIAQVEGRKIAVAAPSVRIFKADFLQFVASPECVALDARDRCRDIDGLERGVGEGVGRNDAGAGGEGEAPQGRAPECLLADLGDTGGDGDGADGAVAEKGAFADRIGDVHIGERDLLRIADIGAKHERVVRLQEDKPVPSVTKPPDRSYISRTGELSKALPSI